LRRFLDVSGAISPHRDVGGQYLIADAAHNNISGKRYIDHWVEAGFECASPINAGAAMMRIEAARRVFLRCWFNETTTEAGA
jgi:hypothetical protein